MRLKSTKNYDEGFKFEKSMTNELSWSKTKQIQNLRYLNIVINVFNVKKAFMPIYKQRGFCSVSDQDSTMVIDFSNLDVP